MKILFVSSECAPFSKSGGLADVAFSLPPALQKTGDDMAIVTPMYRVTQENYGDEFERIKTCQIVLGQRRLACSLVSQMTIPPKVSSPCILRNSFKSVIM